MDGARIVGGVGWRWWLWCLGNDIVRVVAVGGVGWWERSSWRVGWVGEVVVGWLWSLWVVVARCWGDQVKVEVWWKGGGPSLCHQEHFLERFSIERFGRAAWEVDIYRPESFSPNYCLCDPSSKRS